MGGESRVEQKFMQQLRKKSLTKILFRCLAPTDKGVPKKLQNCLYLGFMRKSSIKLRETQGKFKVIHPLQGGSG